MGCHIAAAHLRCPTRCWCGLATSWPARTRAQGGRGAARTAAACPTIRRTWGERFDLAGGAASARYGRACHAQQGFAVASRADTQIKASPSPVASCTCVILCNQAISSLFPPSGLPPGPCLDLPRTHSGAGCALGQAEWLARRSRLAAAPGLVSPAAGPAAAAAGLCCPCACLAWPSSGHACCWRRCGLQPVAISHLH